MLELGAWSLTALELGFWSLLALSKKKARDCSPALFEKQSPI
jgi:hypothetical protein